VIRANGGAIGSGDQLYFELTPSAIRRDGSDMLVNFSLAKEVSDNVSHFKAEI
jgi:hypothetical protein